MHLLPRIKLGLDLSRKIQLAAESRKEQMGN